MAYNLNQKIVIGVSSRALFDLTIENQVFEQEGVKAYCQYQIEHEKDILKPGQGFGLIKALLNLNQHSKGTNPIEVIVMSRNSPDTSLRVFNAIQHYELEITRAVLVSGASLAPYLSAFQTDLFLSAYEDDVKCAIDSGIAAGIICTEYSTENLRNEIVHFSSNFGIMEGENYPMEQIRIAFDGDAVLFTDESERIFQQHGLEAFEENEKNNACKPLNAGPFAKFLTKLSLLQESLGDDNKWIRTALVTARSAPAHERVIRTLRSWNIPVDEAFFLGGIQKKDILKAFGAHIFFDDQTVHTQLASQVVPSARVPYCENATRKRDTVIDEIQSYRTG